jgi:cellulose synthase/poly-beta-1,6-N-acetylglucosamine synthase-like glycosyltransferase
MTAQRDRTVELFRRCATPSAELLSIPRSGKAVALNAGISRARGEILLLTDIRQHLDPGSLRSLVECMVDESVGVVSGELVILSGTSQEEADIGLCWKYERWIRRHVSALGSIPGATGSIYAMRKTLAVPLPARTLLDDVYLPLAAFFKGYRVILDSGARAFDYPTALHSEFRRKVRTQAGVYQTIGAYPRLLLPVTAMSWHFGSHKLGRLLLPFALLVTAISSAGLPEPWRSAALTAQIAFFGMAALDGLVPQTSKLKRASSIARTFVVLMCCGVLRAVFPCSEQAHVWMGHDRGSTCSRAVGLMSFRRLG